MSVLHFLFVVRIDPLLFMVGCLRCLFHKVVFCHWSQSLFHFPVVKNLLPSDFFKLSSVQLVFLLLLVFHHLGLSHLHLSLQIDLINLILIKSFEVVWLNTVGSKHADFSLWILSHEVMIIGELNFVFLLLGPCIPLLFFTLSLFLGQYLIDVISINFILSPRLIMLLLSLFQNIVELNGLLVEKSIDLLLECILFVFFSDLLFTPIFLLHLLHLIPISSSLILSIENSAARNVFSFLHW